MVGADRTAAGVLPAVLVAVFVGCQPATAPTVASDPSPEDAALIAIATAFDAGDCVEVERLADGFRTTDALRFEAVTVWYGRCRYLASDFERALELLDPVAVGVSRYAADGLYYAGRAAYRLDRFDAAVERFARHTQRFDHRSRADDAWYFLARSLGRNGDPNGALAAFGTLRERPDVSPRRIAGAMFYSADAYMQLATGPSAPEWEPAIALLLHVIEHFPDSVYVDNAEYQLARIAYHRGDFAAAESALQAFLTNWPLSGLAHLAHYFMARSVEQQGDVARALHLYEEHELRFGTEAFADNARYRAGRVLFALADYLAAEGRFTGLLADYPQTKLRTAASYFQGRSRYELALYSDALTPLATAAADEASTWADNAAYFAGRSHYRRVKTHGPPEYDAAIVWFDEVLARWPQKQYADDAAYFAGRGHFERGRWAQAEAVLGRILADYPDSPYVDNALYYQVLAWIELGDCQKAVATLQMLEAADTADWTLKATSPVEAACGG